MVGRGGLKTRDRTCRAAIVKPIVANTNPAAG